MKLKNTTDFSDAFLRRMVAWACKQVPLPFRYIKRATFRRTKNSAPYSGRGGGHGITVRIGPASAYPTREFVRHQVTNPGFADRLEALVAVTVHEIYNCRQSADKAWDNGRNFSEPAAVQAEKVALAEFRANRETLVRAWMEPVAESVRPVIPIAEKRQAKTLADLERWQRKLKLAKTKVRKLTIRARYYERKAACRKAEGGAL